MQFINPTNDYAFKRIFGNEKHPQVLISFLNAVLDFPPKQKVVQVEILNPYQAPKIEALKETVLDVRAMDATGRSFIVEMQVEPQKVFGKRAMYYAANSYTQQLKKGDDYEKLNKVYFIGILKFSAMKSENWLSNHLILNKTTYEHYLEDFEFSFIELPKFKKMENQLVGIVEKWTYFVKYLGRKDDEVDYKQLFKGEPAILEALEIAEYHSLNKAEKEIYEYREKKRRDEYEVIRTAEEKGEKRGIEKGREEGLVEGEKRGIEKGRKEERKKIVLQLYREGMTDIKQLSQITGLTIDEVRGILANHPG